ncbi:MAG TPA: excinuclease ABC subunit C [Ignavibacteriales bacterium]|nr:excinuclease ABC subunit C [Ignavibacteriales bacterium]
MFYIYVLHSKKYDKLYIGFTDDLSRRLKEHFKKRSHTTSKMGFLDLVYYEACKSKKDAKSRERQLKTGFGRGYLRRRLDGYLKECLPANS